MRRAASFPREYDEVIDFVIESFGYRLEVRTQMQVLIPKGGRVEVLQNTETCSYLAKGSIWALSVSDLPVQGVGLFLSHPRIPP